MKKIILILFPFLFISSCDYFEDDHENFIEAYKQILIARERYKDDSSKAEEEIQNIYKEHDYTRESFKEEFFGIAGEQPKRFREILDSIRERAKREAEEVIEE